MELRVIIGQFWIPEAEVLFEVFIRVLCQQILMTARFVGYNTADSRGPVRSIRPYTVLATVSRGKYVFKGHIYIYIKNTYLRCNFGSAVICFYI
jgi:hypothetical protein